MSTLSFPARFNGPPDSANGGIAAGRLAALVDTAGPVQVTLRMPPPLDTELRIETVDGTVRAYHDSALVAEATAVVDEIPLVPAVDYELAVQAASRFEGLSSHPFPTCVGCGVERSDGMACHAGPVDPAKPTVVVAEGDGWDGRKAFSRSAGYGEDGRLLGVTRATWIELR
ncbi:MAG: hypothetical protein M3Y42_03740 [Actinomycetota bacterium]|nr:hypothetical protein [Actinomycetota bacterium]MDQ2956061.1 hypothetical protein [Actinomycetota bacterium]